MPGLSVVSSAPSQFARHIDRTGDTVAPVPVVVLRDRMPGEPELEPAVASSSVVVGDPEAWQSHWALLSQARRSGTVLFDCVSLPDVRALSRSRELPPPFAPGERPLWVLGPDGDPVRARLESR